MSAIAMPCPWRPPSLIEWFTAGKVQRNPSTGKMKRNTSTGKIRRNSASNTTCCCTPSCANCAAHVTDWTLSVTAPSLCACQNNGASSSEVIGSASGTFTLAQTADLCVWTYIFPFADLDEYGAVSNTTCTGASAVSFNHFVWSLTIGSSGSWNILLKVGAQTQVSGSGTGADCISAITGSLTGAGCNYSGPWYTGSGSFTATPNLICHHCLHHGPAVRGVMNCLHDAAHPIDIIDRAKSRVCPAGFFPLVSEEELEAQGLTLPAAQESARGCGCCDPPKP